MEKYQEVEMEIIRFVSEDVIVTSTKWCENPGTDDVCDLF